MDKSFSMPIFNPAIDVLHNLSGEETVSRLLFAVSKCKKFVSDGRRIENISWRIWFRDYHHSPIRNQDATCFQVEAISNHKESSVHNTPLLTPSSPPQSIPPIMDGGTVSHAEPNRVRGVPRSGTTITNILSEKLSLASMETISQRKVDDQCVGPSLHDAPSVAAPVLRVASVASTPRDGTPLAPRLVIVNPTPHPTPPATPHIRQPPSSLSNRMYSTHFLAPLEMPPPLQVSDLPLASNTATSSSSPSSSKGSSSSTSSSDQPVAGKLFYMSNQPESASPEKVMPLTPAPTLPTPLEEPKELLAECVSGPEPELELDDTHISGRRDTSSVTSSGSVLTQSHKGKRKQNTGHSRSRSRGKFSMATGSSKSSTSGPRLRAHEIAQAKKAATSGSVDFRGSTHHQSNGPGKGRHATGSRHSRRGSAQVSKRGSPESRVILQRVQTQPLPHAHRPLRNYGNATKLPAHHLAQPLVPRTNTKRRVELVSTSSEDDTEDGSEWSSVREEDEEAEKPPDTEPTVEPIISKASDQLSQAAAEAARQREFFRKRPPSEYVDTAKRHQTGLLTNLFRPDPNLFPEGHPYRTSLSHHDLVAKAGIPGRGPTLYYSATNGSRNPPPPSQVQRLAKVSPPTATTRLSTSRSAVALPELANVTVGSVTRNGGSRNVISPSKSTSTVGTQSTIRSSVTREGYRPRGKPANVELSDSDDDDDDPENSVQVEASIAHKRLAEIAQQRRRSQPQQPEPHLPQPQPQRSSTNEVRATQVANRAPAPVFRSRPVAIGYPYNLPAPTPPLSPNAQRRKMYWEECGISLLKHMNHEQAEGYGLLHEGVRFVKDTKTRAVQAEEKRNRLQRNKSWAADDFHTRGW